MSEAVSGSRRYRFPPLFVSLLLFCSFLTFILLQPTFLSYVSAPKIITGLNYAFNLHFLESLHVLISPFDSDPEATDAPPYLCICLLGQVIKVVFLLPTLHLLNVT